MLELTEKTLEKTQLKNSVRREKLANQGAAKKEKLVWCLLKNLWDLASGIILWTSFYLGYKSKKNKWNIQINLNSKRK